MTEITSSQVASKERPEAPPSDVAAPPTATDSRLATTAPTAPPATTSTQEDPTTSAATPPSLLDHVSSFCSCVLTIGSTVGVAPETVCN